MLDDLNPQAVTEAVAQEPTQQQVQAETQKEYNFRVMRERAEKAEQRARELEENIRRQAQPAQADDEDDIPVDDNSYIEGKDLKKYVKTLKKGLKEANQQIQELSTRTQQSNAEARLKSRFPDIDRVVTEETLQKLAQMKPAAYRSILANPNLEDRGELAYEMITAAGLSGKYDTEEKKLEENKGKPRSAASVAPQASETPLTRVADYDRRILSEERKEQLRRQVEEARKYR